MKKCIAIVLYLFLIIVSLRFDILMLFDIRQIFLVFIGAVIMYMPVIINKKKFIFDGFIFAQNALWASIIQTFVQVFVAMSESSTDKDGLYNIALACRPLLYGFCIWIIFNTDESDNVEINSLSDEIVSNKEIQNNYKMSEIVSDKEIQNNDKISEIVSDKEIQNNDKISENVLYDANKCRICFADMGLTNREIEVAMLIIKKMSNAQIASELYISETTVKKHISNIFSKLEINKRERIIEIIKEKLL